jgi:EmrB/QacA subfamily drug resistance transporter
MGHDLTGSGEVRAQKPPEASIVAVCLVVAAALFMQGLDGAILNTSLPQMAASLGVNAVDLNTVIIAYILAVAVATPVSGWMAHRYGAKRVFAAAIAIFTLASIGCGVATSLPLLVTARVFQGAGGALMWPVGRLVTLRGGKVGLMRSTALVMWPALLAPVVGPVIGGAITSFLGWRWNFFLNLPLGLVGVVLALRIIPEMREERARKPLDVVGALLSGTTLFLLVFGLNRLSAQGELAYSLALVGGGLLAGFASLAWFRTRTHPLLEFSALSVPTFFITRVGAGTLISIAISASPFLLPLMLQQVWGMSPLQAGEWLLDYFLGNLLLKAVTTPVLQRFGFRSVLLITGAGIAASIAACGFLSASTSAPVLGLVLFVAGGTRSIQFTALTTLSFADIEPDQRASAATLHTLLVQLGHAVGIALAAAALNFSRYSRTGAALTQSDFRAAFLSLAILAVVGTVMYLRLDPEAGAEVSGRYRPAEEETAA